METNPQYGQERREYRVKTWLRVLYLAVGAMLLFGGGTLLLNAPAGRNGAGLLPQLIFLGMGVYVVLLALRPRLTIEGTRIDVLMVFRERSADAGEIEGWHTVQARNTKDTVLQLRNGQGTIRISGIFATDDAFRAWMGKMPNLDEKDREALLGEIAQKQELGATPEERLKALKTAKVWSISLAVVGVAAAGLLALGPPALHTLMAVVLAATPVAAALLLHRQPLLYAAFKQKSDPRAEMSFVLLIAAFGLLIHASGLHLVRVEPLLWIAAPATLACLWGFAGANRAAAGRFGIWLGLGMFSCLYGYALAMVADTVDDGRVAAAYRAEVLAKHVSHGRSTSYSLTLAPWGPRTEDESVGVSQHTYDMVEIGDEACIEEHAGNLHVAWFRVVACTESFPQDAP